MARVKIRKEIEIQRNPVERALMTLKESIIKKRKLVVIGLSVFLAVAVVVVTLLIIEENRSIRQQARFDEIIDSYRQGDTSSAENIDRTVSALRDLNKSIFFGPVKELCFYITGNLLYQKGSYQEAAEELIAYEKKASSSSVFAPLALLKAASACELAGNREKARALFMELEDDYSDSPVADQILYRIARFYLSANDRENARRYYERLTGTFPNSEMAVEARKDLFLLGRPVAK